MFSKQGTTGSVERREKKKLMEGSLAPSLVLFRIQKQWLALRTQCFHEVSEPLTIHTIPQKTNEVFLGLVNHRGTLRLCVSLGKLLDLPEKENDEEKQKRIFPRMIVLQQGEMRWLSPVDEVYGLVRFHSKEIREEEHPSVPFTIGTVQWEGKELCILDDPRMFKEIERFVES